ncbi:hypothetical protein JW887_03950 [Candidatus Dojkabacteria bacterium]|nr:hypothetical protein [Candidatus Dojkabacteria bacterium]
MKPILIYTFFRRQCSTFKALRNVTHPLVKNYYFNGVSGLNTFLNHVSKSNYRYIIGIADYRKTARRVRIEDRFINRFSSGKLISEGPEYYTPTFDLPNIDGIRDNKKRNVEFYVSDKATFGSCNRSCYLALNIILKQKLNTKFAFSHIPRSIPVKEIKRIIQSWIDRISSELSRC